MKLLTFQNGKSVSFVHDAEALGCLLYGIMDIASQNRGVVMAEEVEYLARELGYRGSILTVRRLLLSRGYVCEHEKFRRFHLYDANRNSIQGFLQANDARFSGCRLTARDSTLIFERRGTGGTRVEMMMSRIMKHLSVILEELSRIPALDAGTLFSIAEHEVEHFIVMERVEWCSKYCDKLSIETDTMLSEYGMGSRKFRQAMTRYVAVYGHLLDVLATAEEKNTQFLASIRDKESLELLKIFRELLLRFTSAFLKKEGEL